MTIDQVAELAYVSRSVVSRVLNDHPNVSEEARERVMRVIEEHDYRPSSVARSLATDRSFEISVLTPRRGDESLANGYWPLLYSGLFERCLERGYFVSLSMVSDRMEDEIEDRARDSRFDGYVLVTTEVTDLVASTLEADYSQESGHSIVRAWAEQGRMPRALFCASDTMAMGALLALNEAGYAVPDEVALVGFDDLPAAQYTIPPLTTVRQPVYEKGQAAIDLLIDHIENAEPNPEHTELEPELVVRQSCGARQNP